LKKEVDEIVDSAPIKSPPEKKRKKTKMNNSSIIGAHENFQKRGDTKAFAQVLVTVYEKEKEVPLKRLQRTL